MIWKGFFEYKLDEELTEKVDFWLDLSFKDNNFSGYSVDRETKGLFEDGSVSVEGFIDGNLISFVKKYPYNYFFNEKTSRFEIDPSTKNHEVKYEGYFYPEKKKYEGTYRVGSKNYSGSWEMGKMDF
ncbi:MAG: hypothetical protein K0R65_224 [Crocinitomicaceae bacterium]|jgi:hypothetical protein|nr:hypothetical protein [Crocinitomicaceae bacterium]